MEFLTLILIFAFYIWLLKAFINAIAKQKIEQMANEKPKDEKCVTQGGSSPHSWNRDSEDKLYCIKCGFYAGSV